MPPTCNFLIWIKCKNHSQNSTRKSMPIFFCCRRSCINSSRMEPDNYLNSKTWGQLSVDLTTKTCSLGPVVRLVPITLRLAWLAWASSMGLKCTVNWETVLGKLRYFLLTKKKQHSQCQPVCPINQPTYYTPTKNSFFLIPSTGRRLCETNCWQGQYGPALPRWNWEGIQDLSAPDCVGPKTWAPKVQATQSLPARGHTGYGFLRWLPRRLKGA